MSPPESFDELVAAIADDPAYYLYTVDVIPRRANVLPVTEATYRESIFLDNRIAIQDPQWIVAPLWETATRIVECSEKRGCHFIFHVGHCGSTMMSRLLQDFDNVLALREPLALRGVAAEVRQRGDEYAHTSAELCSKLHDFVYRMISRRFRAGQNVVVKGTSDVCNLAQGLLNMDAGNRALLMFLRLEEFLVVMLRNAARREETAHFCASRLQDLHSMGIEGIPPLHELSDGQRAAVSWMANMSWLSQASGERAKLLEFTAFLDQPAEELHAAARFLGLDVSQEASNRVVQGPVLGAYSKDPRSPYNPASRKAELAEAGRQFADEIAAARKWAEGVCRQAQELESLLDHF